MKSEFNGIEQTQAGAFDRRQTIGALLTPTSNPELIGRVGPLSTNETILSPWVDW